MGCQRRLSEPVVSISLVFQVCTPESAGPPGGCSLQFSRFLVARSRKLDKIVKKVKKVKKVKRARSQNPGCRSLAGLDPALDCSRIAEPTPGPAEACGACSLHFSR